MNNIEKIKELLSKDILSPEDKAVIAEIIANDGDARDFYTNYKSISAAVKNSAHLSTDEIGDYVLYLNKMDPENETILKRIPFIEEHLRKCRTCSEEFKELNEEYSVVDEFMDSAPFRKESIDKGRPVQSSLFTKYRSLFAAMLVLGFVYAGLYFVSHNYISPYHQYASLETKEDFYTTRGRSTDYFQRGIKALDDNNLNEAINYLKKDIESNPNDETIFYSHYVLGLVYLETAPKSFIGLFPSYNEENVENGIKNLSEAIEKIRSRQFRNIMFDANFYIGKGYLMLDQPEKAREYFSLVVKDKGSKLEEAKSILKELE